MNLRKLSWALSDLAETIEKKQINRRVTKEYEAKKKAGYFDNEPDEEEDDYEYDSYGIPPGCRACGGDYPNCKWSCPIFDE